MNAQGTFNLTKLPSTPVGRTLANALRAAAAVLVLTAAAPAFANEGDAQEMLANGGDYGVTNKSADGGDYGVTNKSADGGDYVVTNKSADGGDYVVTNTPGRG